jgi:crotonobetainyl-CoA:carnitine CoA-transferase CaiB-like acyl-CoA transferase
MAVDAVPGLGEHGVEILKERRFDDSEIANLQSAGVAALFKS